MDSDRVQLTIWGNRQDQSLPGPGSNFWGGVSACYEIWSPCTATSRVILEAGHGLRQLALQRELPRADILLSSAHWDKIQGIPFTPNFYNPNWSAQIWAPAIPGQSLLESLLGQQRSDLCPVPNFYDPTIGALIELTEVVHDGPLLHPESSLANPPWSAQACLNVPGQLHSVCVTVGDRALLYLPAGAAASKSYPQADFILLGLPHQTPDRFADVGLAETKNKMALLLEQNPTAQIVLTNFLPWQQDEELQRLQFQLAQFSPKVQLARVGQTIPLH